MFDYGFPDNWSALKRLIWIKLKSAVSTPVEKTVSGAIAHITDAIAAPVKALTVNVEPVQAGSGDPSPDNVRLISGRTSATIYHSGADTNDPTTHTIQLGQTVYGGILDVTNGVLTVDREFRSGLGSDIRTNGGYRVLRTTYSTSKYSEYIPPISNMFKWTSAGSFSSPWRVRRVTNGVLMWSFPADYSDEQILAISPTVEYCIYVREAYQQTYQLTPTQIDLLQGENNIWADAVDVTVTYLAEGNASTSEALGILLGGTYNNPGGADDVSDDEALGILLGGS